MSELKGACLCGAISYQVEAPPLMTVICHCNDCQRQTGTSFSLVVGVAPEAVKIKGEATVYTTTGETGSPVHRHFCGKCGSPILSDATDSFGIYFLKAGTLDDTSSLKPEVEIFCDEAQNWCKLSGDWKKAPRNPEA